MITAAIASVIIGSGPARVELAPTQYGYTVTYHNALVSSLSVTPWQLAADAITISGAINARDGAEPDDLIVTPPPGWWCSPCAVTVPEGDSGTVELWPEVGA